MPMNTSYQQNIDLIMNNTTKNKDKMSEKTVIQPESSKSERKLKGLNDMMYNQLIKTDENPLEIIQKDRKDSNLLNRQQEYRKKLASQGLK
ncbi:MAG: hypothetical protein MHPSP_003517 [Paramarteilia canceri]